MSITEQIEDPYIADDGLCSNCKNLSFGIYDIGNETSDISLQRQITYDLVSSSCPFCNTRIEMQEGRVYRCISTGLNIKDCAKAFSTADNSVLKFMYFRHHSMMFGLPRIETFIRTFESIPDELAVGSGNNFSMKVADLDLARAWMEHCHANHDTTCAGSHSIRTPFFKVIDCSSRRICEVSETEPYAALSYVWGSPTDRTTSERTEDSSKFPKTIEDAMLVTVRLGLNYLWVDRYCIDQNNTKEKHSLISNMSKIYSEAEITIIAASGLDAHHGLSGVSESRCLGLRQTIYHQDDLIDLEDAYCEVQTSTWATRAWTYQEMILSRRRLYFTDSQMIFECHSQTFLEMLGIPSTHFPPKTKKDAAKPVLSDALLGCTTQMLGLKIAPTVFPSSANSAEDDIWVLIKEYSGRCLSYMDDTLNAFEGIFDARARGTGAYVHHFWGIPISERTRFATVGDRAGVLSFIHGLLWFTADNSDDKDHTAELTGTWFPSWSWARGMSCNVSHHGFPPIDESMVGQNQESIWATLIHMSGEREELWRYAQGRLDQSDYQPMVEFSSWLLEDVDLIYDPVSENIPTKDFLFTHPSFQEGRMSVQLDSRSTRHQTNIIAVYLGRTENTEINTPTQLFLLAERNTAGSLRRIGLGWCKMPKAYNDYKVKGEPELRWLPGPDQGDSLNAWKHGTVILE